MKTTTYTNEQKVAAVGAILDAVAALDNVTDSEREFVRYAATCDFAGKMDEGTGVALATVAAHLHGKVDSIVNKARLAAKDVVRKQRWTTLREQGKTPCSRCDATGVFINGGECYRCNGRGCTN